MSSAKLGACQQQMYFKMSRYMYSKSEHVNMNTCFLYLFNVLWKYMVHRE